ncbi:MAG: EamA family transporter RarD [SAR324 cluster bacterium]|nr:EamA family transporter RarD [SAR324 cluster bacterium]
MKKLSEAQHTEAQIGVGYALLAFFSWGFLPIYWKLLDTIPSLEILAHRMVWSVVFLTVLLAFQRRLAELRELFKNPRYILMLLGTAALLGVNWFVYIYGVNTDQVIETSLGYYINPLLNVLMGAVFLKERLNHWQSLALGMAALGVLIFLLNFGSLPWIALSLAFTFSLYGIVRKVIPVKPLVGLLMETMLLAPVAALLIIFWEFEGTGNLGIELHTDLYLLGAGVVTSLPLLWFTNAGKRLRYSTLGFIQYMTPSIQLLIGVYLYNEPFTHTHSITFGLIWAGLIIYSLNSLKLQRTAK